MKKRILSVFVLASVVASSMFTFGSLKVKAEIASDIKVPSFQQLKTNAKLPDPFKMLNGTRMTDKSQWAKRREEISALAQTFEFGIKPPKPQSVKGSMSGKSIKVSISENGKSTSFSCSIQYPTTGKAPYPAMIGINMNTLRTSEILKLGVALITFPADSIGQENGMGTRGKGKFYDVYGSNHSAGALMAWAWGVDCLIDALETTPDAKIDPTKLGVTGGSRNGKGALICGAFCERIALTIPQESGNGGASGWRTADAQKASGANVQTLSQIITEQPWFGKALDQFRGQTNKLPHDHHEVLALCAPRGLLVIENTQMEWLGKQSCYDTCKGASLIYSALGVGDNFGFSQVGHPDHCGYVDAQVPELKAYIKKFLLGDTSANTKIFKTDGGLSFNSSKWVDWPTDEIPGVLSGTTPEPTPTISPEVLLGDVDGDKDVNSIDFGFLRQYLLGMIKKFPATNGLIAADINKDGNVDSIDFGTMRKLLLSIK